MPLTFVSRTSFVYPSGQQSLHANFHADGNGFYFASSGKIFAFNTSGRAISANDITLQNHPGSTTIWGFTKTTAGQWATLTRDSLTGVIGTIRLFSETGTAIHTARVPDAVTGINTVADAWRAPKALVEVDGNFYVRVVRNVSGNMRWVKFDNNLQVQSDDLVINNVNPTALSDAASGGYRFIFIVQQNENKVYAIEAINATIISSLETNLDSRNTGGRAASVYDGDLYIADTGGYIYRYSGVPIRPEASTGRGGGISILSMMHLNAMLGRDFRRRRL